MDPQHHPHVGWFSDRIHKIQHIVRLMGVIYCSKDLFSKGKGTSCEIQMKCRRKSSRKVLEEFSSSWVIQVQNSSIKMLWCVKCGGFLFVCLFLLRRLIRDSVPRDFFIENWSCRHLLPNMYQNSRLTEVSSA